MSSEVHARDSVRARRAAILEAAGEALEIGHVRRVRRARIAAFAACVAAAAALTTLLSRQSQERAPSTRTAEIALDFSTVGPAPITIDFARVEASSEIELDMLSDAEMRGALEENGYCASLLRFDGRAMLVDCTTGLPVVFR
ncbi:MAG: hypothetical protein LW636_03295 [Planctomycetaceae bacterium]|jgi:hypothetical protein|nr:hypothetical protein [Planctomycetaceae bacterium]